MTGNGWVIGASLIGCFVGPMLYRSGTTHGPAIDIGLAWHALWGAGVGFVIVIAVQLCVAKLRFTMLRVIEILTATAVLAMLLLNYNGALRQFEASERRSQEQVQLQQHGQMDAMD